MSKPVIILAFSNTRDEYLPLINRERKNIYRTLRRHDDNGLIKVEKSEQTTLEDLFESINHYCDQLAVFHYGGHAGTAFLQLENAQAEAEKVRAKGIAEALGQAESLKLVFLNGCATGGQVKMLLDAGVPAVIATSVSVQDEMATEFAEQFYHSLASHVTIQKAFEFAKAFLVSRYDLFDEMGVRRGIEELDEKAEKVPWGLYCAKGKEEVLEWALPQSAGVVAMIKKADYENARVDVNDILIDSICEELAKYSPDLDSQLSKTQLDIPAIKREIIDCFPLPIGEQIRKLFTRSNDPNKPDELELFTRKRLEQLILTYRNTMQFISFIMLSQLWDEKFENPALNIGEDYIVEFNSFFALNEASYQSFEYVKFIKTITDIFDERNIPYFIEELKQVKMDVDQNPDLYTAYVFFNSVHQSVLNNAVNDNELQPFCLQAEEHLGIILKEFAFLVKYKLMTIKNIEIVKIRHQNPRFRHNQVLLNRALTVAGTGIAEVGVEFDNFADNQSVLFLKTKDNQIEDYLSLSPFLLDENALLSVFSSKLFMYCYSDRDSYFFQFINNASDPKLVVNDSKYPTMKSLFEKFKTDFFGHQAEPAKGASLLGKSRFSKNK